MAPTVALLTDPPAQLAANTAMSPAPRVRASFPASDPDVRHRDGADMVVFADVYDLAHPDRSPARFRGASPTVADAGGTVRLEWRIPGVVLSKPGRYYMRVAVGVLDGGLGAKVVGAVETESFEVY